MNTIVSGSALAAALICLSTAASAHVTFETAQVPPNATVKAVLRVPHGCDGKECGAASERWEEVAQAGQDAHNLKFPAPTIMVAAGQGTVGQGTPAPASSSVKVGALVIQQPWSRATPGGAKVGGGYVRITNTGQTPDRLLGGSFAASGRVELHDMSVSEGVMRMKGVEGGLEIAPGATLELKPGGYHAMFVDLKRPLREGERVDGTLLFEKAGSVPVTFTVRGIGAQNAGEDHSQH